MEVSPAVVGPLRRGTITVVATGLGGMLHTFSFLTESWHRAKARLRGTPKRLPECIELWRLCQGYSQHIPKRTVALFAGSPFPFRANVPGNCWLFFAAGRTANF